jgi:hypothetical protein
MASKVARVFAGQAGLTAYTLLAVAEGAVHWRRLEAVRGPVGPAATINRKSAPPSLMRLPEAPRYRAFSITLGRPINSKKLRNQASCERGSCTATGRPQSPPAC